MKQQKGGGFIQDLFKRTKSNNYSFLDSICEKEITRLSLKIKNNFNLPKQGEAKIDEIFKNRFESLEKAKENFKHSNEISLLINNISTEIKNNQKTISLYLINDFYILIDNFAVIYYINDKKPSLDFVNALYSTKIDISESDQKLLDANISQVLTDILTEMRLHYEVVEKYFRSIKHTSYLNTYICKNTISETVKINECLEFVDKQLKQKSFIKNDSFYIFKYCINVRRNKATTALPKQLTIENDFFKVMKLIYFFFRPGCDYTDTCKRLQDSNSLKNIDDLHDCIFGFSRPSSETGSR